MGDSIGLVLMLFNVGIFVALALQIHAFLRGGTIISARQLGARVVCGVLLIVIITMIYYGLAHTWTDPTHALIFWAVMAFLAMLLFVVALMDFRETCAIGELRRAKLYTGAARAAIRTRRRSGKQDTGS